MNADMLVGRLCDQLEHEKWVKRNTKSKILFRVQGDSTESYRTIRVTAANRQAATTHLVQKYGDKIVEMLGGA